MTIRAILVAVLASVLVGCGDSSSKPPPPTEPAPAPKPPPGKKPGAAMS